MSERDEQLGCDDDMVSESLGEIRKAVVEEIMAHCDSVRGYGATLPEFEAKLIAGCVVHRLRLARGLIGSADMKRSSPVSEIDDEAARGKDVAADKDVVWRVKGGESHEISLSAESWLHC